MHIPAPYLLMLHHLLRLGHEWCLLGAMRISAPCFGRAHHMLGYGMYGVWSLLLC